MPASPLFLAIRSLIAIPLLLILLWIVLLHPARQHPGLERLRKYRYAHRGLHDKPRIPENSMAAFRLAAEHGFGVELDVHLTRDGRLAVIHDSSLLRTCGHDVLVEDLTAEELSPFRLEGTDEQIPFLEYVLPLFEDRAPLIVELKPLRGNHAALSKAATECLDRFRAEYCVESFDPRCVSWLKKNRPDVIRGQLAENFFHSDTKLSFPLRFACTHLLFNPGTRPDFVAYRYQDLRMPANRIACGLWNTQSVTWTICKPEDMIAAEQNGSIVIFEQFTPESTPVS